MENQNSMPARFGALAGSAALALGIAAPAQAQGTSPSLLLPAAAAFVSQADCFRPAPAVQSIAQQVVAHPQLSKSAAILGGASALDRMRQAQTSGGAATNIEQYVPGRALTPGAQGFGSATNCTALTKLAATSRLPQVRMPKPTGDILSSRRIAINHTMFDADWKRVRGAGLSRSRANAFIGGRPASDLELIRKVNRVTNHRIRYVEDRVQFDRPDYWAGAQATIASGKGDCEDYAITKMQLLIAHGFRPEDLTLTIAKDMIHGSDHAVLLVRHEGRYLMLDNVTDRILDGSLANEYKPIFSYSDRKAWLHGYALNS